jgi:hypothetical protein
MHRKLFSLLLVFIFALSATISNGQFNFIPGKKTIKVDCAKLTLKQKIGFLLKNNNLSAKNKIAYLNSLSAQGEKKNAMAEQNPPKVIQTVYDSHIQPEVLIKKELEEIFVVRVKKMIANHPEIANAKYEL